MSAAMTEDTLVQRTTADYLHDELGWDSVFAYNEETFGPEGTLGRLSDKEVILTRYLREALVKLNPGLPDPAYRSAISRITDYSFTQSPLQINREKYDLLKNGVPVEYRNERGEVVKRRLRVFDFDRPEENYFLVVRELWIKGQLYRRRADIMGFVNGIPLLFMELKNVNKEIRAAYEQNLADYKDTVPHLLHHNAVIVLANGIDAKIGSLSSRYEHFHEWKRLEETAPGVVSMETLLKGICAKGAFMDMFENFILFDDSSGKTVKIVARNHQFLGVNRAVQAVRDRQERQDHPFRIVIVCAMWLTGFDVPCLATLYLDKPLKARTLMQAVARANRVYEGKNNGLIVDYCGILKNLRKALATFAGHQGGGIIDGGGPQPQVDPVKPEEELLADLAETVAMVRGFLTERDFRLEEIMENSGFARNKAIAEAKEAVNENDETRKRFEIIAREVFKKFKACITVQGVNDYRMQYDAVNIIYKSLLEDRDRADISAIIRELHYIVDATITTVTTPTVCEGGLFDISKIDFDRLRQEFERSSGKNSTVQYLKTAIDQRLARMIQQNPLRTDFHKHYQEIIAAYNSEKDRATIERTFEELMKFVTALDEEEHRAIREGLDEESLAMFDLLIKPELSKNEREQIKRVAKDLLETLKAEKLQIENWPEKEATRSAIRVTIRDFLYNEATGLPVSFYSDEEVETKTDLIYQNVFMQYRGYGAQVYKHSCFT